MLGLCTSSKTTIINEFIIHNIELTNNIFKYINRPIFISNSTFSEYIKIDDNFENFPKYTKEEVLRHPNKQEGLISMASDMQNGYIRSLHACNFNDPIVLYDIQYQYYKLGKDDPIPKLKYSKDVEYLRYKDLNNSDIVNLVENMLNGNNIDGISLFKINHIKY